MPIKEFTIGTSRTINLGNFESLRLEASVRWELTPDQGVEQQKDLAQAQLRQLLEDTYRAQTKTKEKKIA